VRPFPRWIIILVLLGACRSAGGPDGAPAVPTGLAATPGDGQVILTWDAMADADLASYRVYRGATAQQLSRLQSVGAGTETFSDDTTSNGTTYFYALTAVDRGGNESAKSAVVEATPVADAVPDTIAPVVVLTDPPANTVGVAVNYHIGVSFSEPMDKAATEAAVDIAPAVTCQHEWNPTASRLTCRPVGGLAAATTYEVTLSSQAADLAGNHLATDYAFAFTTGAQELQTCLFDADATFGGCVFGR